MSRHDRYGRSRTETHLEMTAMIDVVFLLLIFFVVVFRPVDLLATLDVDRSSGGPSGEKPILEITVEKDGCRVNGNPVGLAELDAGLRRLGSLSAAQRIMVSCAPASPHEGLIRVLDLCARYNITDIALVSRAGSR